MFERIGGTSFSDERLSSRLATFIIAKPAPTIAIIVSFLGGLGIFAVWLVTGSLSNDFGVYWRTANTPVEWAYWPGYEYPFPYEPTMLLWISPLKLFPMWPAFFLWAGFSAWAIYRAARPYMERRKLWLLLACPAVTNGLLTGQVSTAMAALILWAFGTRNRVVAGIAFGVVASIKPQLVIMAPLMLLFRRDWRAVMGAAAAFLSLAAMSALLFGADIWPAWLASLAEFRTRLTEIEIINVGSTPAAVAESWGLRPLPFLLLGALAGGWIVHRFRNTGPLEATAAVGVGSLLAAPYALPYDLAVVAPLLVCAVFRGRVLAALGLSGIFAPLPLLISTIALFRRTQEIAALNSI